MSSIAPAAPITPSHSVDARVLAALGQAPSVVLPGGAYPEPTFPSSLAAFQRAPVSGRRVAGPMPSLLAEVRAVFAPRQPKALRGRHVARGTR